MTQAEYNEKFIKMDFKWENKNKIFLPFGNIKCNFCGIKSIPIKKCGKCKKAYYCNIECQKNDWNSHKIHCIEMNIVDKPRIMIIGGEIGQSLLLNHLHMIIAADKDLIEEESQKVSKLSKEFKKSQKLQLLQEKKKQKNKKFHK